MPASTATRTATFGMGCFWGPDARSGAMPGVVRTRVGYAGGTTPDPTYHDLGDHTEVVQIEYDPEQLAYDDLLDTFWSNHAWASASRKRQYRGVVLAHGDEQFETAQRRRDEQSESGLVASKAQRRRRDELADRSGETVATDVERLDEFYLAEDYHQKYELRSTPVVGDELAELYGDAFVDSTVTARLNGFVAGHGDDELRASYLDALDLPETVIAELRRRF